MILGSLKVGRNVHLSYNTKDMLKRFVRTQGGDVNLKKNRRTFSNCIVASGENHCKLITILQKKKRWQLYILQNTWQTHRSPSGTRKAMFLHYLPLY